MWPETIDTFDLAVPNALAKTRTTSSFAAPSTGGADILTFKLPSCSPTIWLFDARGATRIVNVIESSFSVKWIKRSLRKPDR